MLPKISNTELPLVARNKFSSTELPLVASIQTTEFQSNGFGYSHGYGHGYNCGPEPTALVETEHHRAIARCTGKDSAQ